jgi:hypothetical protein
MEADSSKSKSETARRLICTALLSAATIRVAQTASNSSAASAAGCSAVVQTGLSRSYSVSPTTIIELWMHATCPPDDSDTEAAEADVDDEEDASPLPERRPPAVLSTNAAVDDTVALIERKAVHPGQAQLAEILLERIGYVLKHHERPLSAFKSIAFQIFTINVRVSNVRERYHFFHSCKIVVIFLLCSSCRHVLHIHDLQYGLFICSPSCWWSKLCLA